MNLSPVCSSFALAGLTSLLVLPSAPGAVVSSCDEAGLRAALAAGGPVTFACDGTIILTSPIVVTTAISLAADGRNVRLSGGGMVRLFEVGPNGSVHLQGLTLSEGYTKGADGNPAGEGKGGAILVEQGEFHASDCRFEANSSVGGNGTPQPSGNPVPGGAARGGAVYVAQGVLRLTNCVFLGNTLKGALGPMRLPQATEVTQEALRELFSIAMWLRSIAYSLGIGRRAVLATGLQAAPDAPRLVVGSKPAALLCSEGDRF